MLGENKEITRWVSDLIVGLTFLNHFLLSMYPSLLIFLTIQSIYLDHHPVNKYLTNNGQLQ